MAKCAHEKTEVVFLARGQRARKCMACGEIVEAYKEQK
jgi:DTW domain-containing protein YfiP